MSTTVRIPYKTLIMKRCPESHLPIRKKPEWIASHPKNNYMTVFNLIGNDIIYFTHHARHDDIHLSGIDSRKFLDILRDLDLTTVPVYLLGNFKKVRHIGYHYSTNFLNFAFNWGRNIRMVALYNIDENVRTSIERFRLIAPENICIAIAGSYRKAMSMIMKAKQTKKLPDKTDLFPGGADSLRNELLACITRVSLLQIFNQQLHPPARGHELYPYFMALEVFKKDMEAKNTLFSLKKKAMENDYNRKWTELCMQLKQEIEKHADQVCSHKNQLIKLETDIRLRKEELRELKNLEQKQSQMTNQLARHLKILGNRNKCAEKTIPIPASTSGLPEKEIHEPADTLFTEKLKERHPGTE